MYTYSPEIYHTCSSKYTEIFKHVICHECFSEAAMYQVQPGVCATETESRLKVTVVSQPNSLETLPETTEGSGANLSKTQFHTNTQTHTEGGLYSCLHQTFQYFSLK